MAIYRREFLKAGAALVAAAAAQQNRMAFAGQALNQSADDVLKGAVDAGDLPGVIAMATTPGGTIYHERRRVLHRYAEELGPELHDQRADGADGPHRRQPGRGWRIPTTGSTGANGWRVST